MGKSFFGFLAVGAGLVVGSLIGYKLATDAELRGKILRGAKDTLDVSKKHINEMSEDVALRTAQLTRNPQINRDWVENQWDSLGL